MQPTLLGLPTMKTTPEIFRNDSGVVCNIDAEIAILGAILFDPDSIERVDSIIAPVSFYVSAHAVIYRTMLLLRDSGLKPDLMTVTTRLRDLGELDKVGGKKKISELAECVSAVNIDQYAQLVQDKFLRRKLGQISDRLLLASKNEEKPIAKLLDEAEQLVLSIQRPTGNVSSSLAEIMPQTFTTIENHSLGLSTPGIPCGFYDIDAMTQGLQRSDLIIAAGRPAMGKTSFALSIALSIAGIQKLPVQVFSLEMSKEQLVYRLIAQKVQIESSRLRSGKINQNEWKPLATEIDNLSKLPIFIDDTPSISVAEIRSKCRQTQADQGCALGCIVLDYLQLMEGNGDNRVQELSKITRSLKGLARELNVPIIALSQLSRGVESRTNKRPMMSDLRESGAIEQDADLIMMLYREEYYDPDTPDRGIAEVIITKHRNGPTGTVRLLFEPQLTRFRNLAPTN